jgi:hypothetical protein
MQNPYLSAPAIKAELSLDVSSRTIQRRLCEVGLNGRRPAKTPLLSAVNVKKRLKFAQDHISWTVADWSKVIWSDESKFMLFTNDSGGYVRRPVNERFNQKYTTATVKFGGGSIMVWGCFSGLGLGPLHRINGIMDRFQYRDILSEVMLPHAAEKMPPDWVFQHDNDPKHTSVLVKEFLSSHQVTVMSWPPQSPDLNPIENLWGEIGRRLKGTHYRNGEELFSAIEVIWESLPHSLIQSLVESMPRRCDAVIKARGQATKY